MKGGSQTGREIRQYRIVTERAFHRPLQLLFLAVFADCLLIGCVIDADACRFMQEYARNMQNYAELCSEM